ncbi:hypothetical protein NL676_014541 [Syzygium grande]|nr:hypothetical protein NL676_014541 [Syzygium grande]
MGALEDAEAGRDLRKLFLRTWVWYTSQGEASRPSSHSGSAKILCAMEWIFISCGGGHNKRPRPSALAVSTCFRI